MTGNTKPAMPVERVPLRQLSRAPIASGVGESARPYDPSGLRFVRTTDIAGPMLLKADTRRSLPVERGRTAPLERWDLLLSSAGTIGKSYLHVLDDEAACYAGFLVRIKPRDPLTARFLSYWTQTPEFLDQAHSGASVSTIANFSAGKYRSVQATIPTAAADMVRIVRYLDHAELRLAGALGAKARTAALLAERRAAVTSGHLAGLWEEGVATQVRGVFSQREEFGGRVEEFLSLSGTYGVRAAGSRSSRRLAKDLAGYRRVRPGDLVVNKLIAQDGALATSQFEGIVSPAYWVLRPDTNLIHPNFAHHLFRSRFVLDQVGRRSKYQPPAQYDIRWREFRAIELRLPSLEQQARAAAELDEAAAAITAALEATQREIALLGEYRTRLIADVVTGRRDIRVEAATLPDIDPAEVARARATGTLPGEEEGDDEPQ
jgi:hypothetical protein